MKKLSALLFVFSIIPFNPIYSQDTLRVLFLGNSMTYVQDLPALLTNLASSNGKTIITSQNTPGGYFLSDHVTDPVSLNLMAQNFDYIVVQEQSSGYIQPANPSPLITRPIEVIDSFAKSHCSKLLLYATPGYPETYPGSVYSYEDMQADIIHNYSLTAHSVRATCLPTGHAFRDVIRTYPSITGMWASPTDYHPGIKGQYLHACVLYSVLYNESSLGSPAPFGISVAEANMLQETAWNFTKDSSLQFGFQFLDSLVTGFQKSNTGLNVLFQDTSSSFINRIEWDFGDFSGISISEPILFQEFGLINHTYSDTGCYLVKRKLFWGDCEFKMDSALICLNETSLFDVIDEHAINIFPNPFSDQIFIQSRGLSGSLVSITNLSGQLVVKQKFTDLSLPLNLSFLDNGVYFIEILNDNKRINFRVIKN